MKKSDSELFVHWAHEAGRLGLVKCSSGNMSQRLDDGTLLISGTGTWLSEISINEISHITVNQEETFNDVKPSAEILLHSQIYQNRPDINTILHFQSPSATAIACMEFSPDYNVIIEVPIYIGKIGNVPYIPPGTKELAAAVSVQINHSDLVQLANHGQVVCGKNYKETIQKAVFFELACSILIMSNFTAKALPIAAIEKLKEYKI